MAGFESLADGSRFPMAINGAPGRIASQLLFQSVEGEKFLPVMANTSKGTLYDRWAAGLENDEIYGPTGITQVRDITLDEMEIVARRVRGSTSNALSLVAPHGKEVSLLGSSESRPDWIHWKTLGLDHEGRGSYTGANREEVAEAMKYLTVFDASTLKVDTSNGHRRAPEHRHPGLHLSGGARLVVITSPFDVDNKRYSAEHRIETVVGGVNDDQANLERLLGKGVRGYAESSCSTNGIMSLLKAVRLGGFKIAGLSAVIMHANTQSDNGIGAMDLRPSGSGSTREVARLLPAIGVKIDPRHVHVHAYRLPIAVGSLIDMTVRLHRGDIPGDLIGQMKAGVEDAGLTDRIRFSQRDVTAFSLGRDRSTVTINEDVKVTKEDGRVVARFALGFQNETGFTGNVLHLGHRLVSTLRGMDEAGEISGK